MFEVSLLSSSLFIFKYNKPERVFGLQMRCRELDSFKILEIFWGIFRIFGEFLLLGGFLGGILLEELFGRNFLGGFFWEDFLGGFFGRIFLGGFFGRNYLVEINMDWCFCQDLGVILSQWRRRKEEEFLILGSARQAHRT